MLYVLCTVIAVGVLIGTAGLIKLGIDSALKDFETALGWK